MLRAAVFSSLLLFCWAESAADRHKVVPDVIDKAPETIIKIEYDGGASVDQGNELTPTQVKDLPTVEWPVEKDALYTLAMVDPDAPSRDHPSNRSFLHYLVVDVLGNNIKEGLPLFGYVGSGPPKGSGLHRYVWLVYKQSKSFAAKPHTLIPSSSRTNRSKFSIRKFAEENELGDPVAINFYQAQWDDYVPILHAGLS